MTKADIAKKFQDRSGLNQKISHELVAIVFEVMKKTLEEGGHLKISGFGCFRTNRKNDRRGRNPQTGESLTISARRVLTFKPSSILKTKLNSTP